MSETPTPPNRKPTGTAAEPPRPERLQRQPGLADVLLATAFRLGGFLLVLVALLALLDVVLSRRPIAGWVAGSSALAALGLLLFSGRLGRH